MADVWVIFFLKLTLTSMSSITDIGEIFYGQPVIPYCVNASNSVISVIIIVTIFLVMAITMEIIITLILILISYSSVICGVLKYISSSWKLFD